MPDIADKFTRSAQGRLLWPGTTKIIFQIVVVSVDFSLSQQARSTLGPSPTISGCRASDTAGDIRITSACTPKIAAAR
jgi:hypothetical protein